VGNILLEKVHGENVDSNNIKSYKDKFKEQISDDLNLPNALSVLWEVIKDDKLNNSEKLNLIESFDSVLSLDLTSMEIRNHKNSDELWINKLIEERNAARKAKDWVRSDEIRNTLFSKGIELLDTKQGTNWKYRI
jgi:cysteinyl-tRNA synthetase